MTNGPFLFDQNQNAPDSFPLAHPLPMTGMLELMTPADDLTWVIQQLATENKHYRDHALASDYYEGRHRIVLDTSEHQAAFRSLLARMKVNICPAVVDALTDRLKIKGFTAAGETAKAIAERADLVWNEQGLARTANRVHSEAVATGDAFLLVWPDVDGVPRCYPHTSLEMCHAHDPERPEIITKAGKLWREGKKIRITLYYPDRIEKYITARDVTDGSTLKADAFVPLDSEREPWPLPNDYGQVPVFHFPYNANSHGHGISALRDVIPIQDSINHTMLNRAVTIDFAATPMRVLIGVEADVDENGRPLQPIRAGIDKMLTLANPDAKLAQFDAAALAPFHDALKTDLNLITVITGIPPHHFQVASGDFPSGESLKVSETRLVKRVEDTQIDLGGEWAQVMAFVLRILGVDGATLLTEWMDAQTRSENDEVERAATKVERVGISKTKAWEELGYSMEEIAAMQAEAAEAAATAAEQFTRAFDRGQVS